MLPFVVAEIMLASLCACVRNLVTRLLSRFANQKNTWFDVAAIGCSIAVFDSPHTDVNSIYDVSVPEIDLYKTGLLLPTGYAEIHCNNFTSAPCAKLRFHHL